jgi:hypothetical protein
MGGGVLAAAEPAPLETAQGAGHVIATGDFLNEALALLTFLDIGCVLPIVDLF